jgi:hypothetical protein
MNRDQVADAFCTFMDWPATIAPGLVAVMLGEGSEANCNPLDDERVVAGSTPYNPAGVQNYSDLASAFEAYKETLSDHIYAGVNAAAAGGSPDAFVAAWANSPWGTWQSTTEAAHDLSEVRTDPAVGQVEVAGTAPAPPTPSPTPPSPVEVTVQVPQLSSQGPGPYTQPAQPVRVVQLVVGVTADGKFGPATEAAVKAFQAAHGLAQDGIVGPDTWGALVNG